MGSKTNEFNNSNSLWSSSYRELQGYPMPLQTSMVKAPPISAFWIWCIAWIAISGIILVRIMYFDQWLALSVRGRVEPSRAVENLKYYQGSVDCRNRRQATVWGLDCHVPRYSLARCWR
jgi:hypothetical protein